MNLIKLQKGIVYGPIKSRRLGRSLGINLMPTTSKLCSLNCCYCQYGWTKIQTTSALEYKEQLPTVTEVIIALKQSLEFCKDFEYLTFSGNGEPTLHPDFPQIVEAIKKVRDQILPNVKMAILSNSSTCGDPQIKEALEKIDLPIMKLDVGNELAFKRMNHGVPPVTLQSIMEGLKSLKKFVIQSMFVRGKIDNSTDWEVISWIRRLQELKPLRVQIYSLDRGTASRGLEKVETSRLKEIVQLAKELTCLRVEVYNNNEKEQDLSNATSCGVLS
jgi:wyosine [tRNA(Phe)-imidazoG37] synthetase (radical SAM superfamily)